MRFVVKVSNWVGAAGWIASVGKNGVRAVGTRERAQIFKNRDEASQALTMLLPHFPGAGIRFSLEPIDTDAQITTIEKNRPSQN
jgi:hypothetical protein